MQTIPIELQEWFTEVRERLNRLALKRFPGRLKSKVDPEDLVASALKSFWRGWNAQEGWQQNAWGENDQLWKLLAKILRDKINDCLRHYRRGRRDVNREESGPELTEQSPETRDSFRDTISKDACDHLLEILPEHDRSRDIVLLAYGKDYSDSEIADELQMSRPTVQRRRTRALELLAAWAVTVEPQQSPTSEKKTPEL